MLRRFSPHESPPATMPKRRHTTQGGAERSKARRVLKMTTPKVKVKSKTKATGRAAVRKTLLDLAEQKRFDWRYDHSGGLGNGQWKIDPNVFSRITTGTSNTNRVGDEIYCQSVEISGVVQLPGDRPNSIVRMVASLTDHSTIPSEASGFAMRISPSNVVSWIAGALDEQVQTIKADRFIIDTTAAQTEIEPSTGQRPIYVPFHVVIPVNKKLFYKDSTQLSGTNALNIGYWAADGRGGLTDTVAFVYSQCSVFFKDV